MCKAPEEMNGNKDASGQEPVNSKLVMLTGFLAVTTIAFLGSTIGLAVKNNGGETVAVESEVVVKAISAKGPEPSIPNPCEGTDPKFDSKECIVGEINGQSGANVTKGYNGELNTTVEPITEAYWSAGLCPVNVHWHLGAEHLSVGQYDETGSGPTSIGERRKLAGKARQGFQCTLYDETDEKFTKPYTWQHCDTSMEVGQTYEVHWPHSALGACGTVNQYQTPFYDGVFCHLSAFATNLTTHSMIGVQAQVFTIVNDEEYYYPDMMRGMIVDGDAMGTDLAMYTGSTTSDSKSNTVCSQYSPITWQVDRTCHLVSASSFDKMCADMKAQRDDMSDDLYAHGSRELVADEYAANNHANLRKV